MNENLLQGEFVRLVHEEPEKLANLEIQWGANSEYLRLLDWDPARRFSVPMVRKWIEKQYENPNSVFFSIQLIQDDRIIGGIGLDSVSWTHGEAFVGIGLGSREDWGKGYGTDAMKVLLGYAFTELNLRRITLDVFEYNQRGIRSYEKAGFVVEGRMRGMVQREGRRWDLIFMGILREEWLRLERKKGSMEENLNIPNAPEIPGLVFRRFRGEADYALMAELIRACKTADRIERTISVEEIANNYSHLDNCDPQKDMLFAEVNGQTAAYGRTWWIDQADGLRLYATVSFLHPDWRGKGIGSAMWAAAEEHIRQIAAGHPKETPKVIQVEVFEGETAMRNHLERYGYEAVRFETHMVRNLAEPFPDAPMPEGLEVRPVKSEHIRPIFDASNEAFLDHWGSVPETETQYQAQLAGKDFHPELWKVAWEGDQIASVIHNFVNEDENMEYKRKRGYTEGICTLRPWRKRGLARALLVESMRMFKEMGMTETALGVDSQNLSGAFRLYESVGYRKVSQSILYRKPLE